MNRKTYSIALGALLLPIVLRALWFYQGFSIRPKIATPDYAALTAPQPPVETPSAEKVKPKQFGGIVVVDAIHSNQFQPDEIQSLKEAVEERGGSLQFLSDSSMLVDSLKYASAYLVIAPSTTFYASEITAIVDFEKRGGRLLVLTDATRGMILMDYFSGSTTVYPDANYVNPLLEPFGITINNDYLYNLPENEGNFRNVLFDDFGKSELTFGLKQVAFYGTHSVESRSGLILFQGNESTFSSITDAHNSSQGPAAISEDGNVAAFGDFTFLTSPYDSVADNATLIDNIADFLLDSKREPTLVTFPYVFNNVALQIYLTSDVQMTAELVSALSGLQSSLHARNMSMEVVSEKPHKGDTLVIGTFTPNEELDSFTNDFNIVLDDFSEFITLPGFGNIGRAGNGVLLFIPGKEGNTLVVLADTQDDLPSILSLVSTGYLDTCIVQDSIAVCSIGYGGSFSDGGDTEEILPAEDGTFPEATPTALG